MSTHRIAALIITPVLASLLVLACTQEGTKAAEPAKAPAAGAAGWGRDPPRS